MIVTKYNAAYFFRHFPETAWRQKRGKIDERAKRSNSQTKRQSGRMAKGKRKRKAPSQCGAHSADELSNASHEEDIVLLSQPCSSVASVSSPAGKYIPKFSSKKSKLSKSKEELLEAPPKRIPSFSCEKAVVGGALQSKADGGLEDTVADQLALQQASGEDKEPKQSTIGERTLVLVLKKVGQRGCLFVYLPIVAS